MDTTPLKEPAIQQHRQYHRTDRIGTSGFAKRIFDVVSALVALIIAGPFLCWFAARRRMFGREVLTRTERVGKYGQRFIQYGLSGVSQDRLLHDLPVLLNILAGRMSFIGPRPASPGDPILNAVGQARLSVKPGLICCWWLRKRGNIDFDDEAASDREYLDTACLATDLGIALRTIPAMVFSERRELAPRTLNILGLRIDNLSMAEALHWIRLKLSSDGQSFVCMTNAHCANISCGNQAYQEALLSSGLNLADGVGLRIAAKLKRTPIRQNVNGTDLFPRLCDMLQTSGHSIYLLGGRPGIACSVAEWIRKQYPDTVVAGYRDGYFPPCDEDSVAEVIASSGASLLLVAMGVPGQELWIRRNLPKTGVRVAIGVGGLFDFYSGRIPRAPVWMREVGLEWTYRLIQEPGRMWKRYLIGNWTFLARHLLFELKVYRAGVPRHNEIQP
jgi:N-acetylglucosaminyldiphosphoundecaprenol N-acetyl-beta-D-mannosaminyltransferase